MASKELKTTKRERVLGDENSSLITAIMTRAEITTSAERALVAEALLGMKKLRKKIKGFFERLRETFNEGLARLREDERDETGPLDAAIAHAAELLGAYDDKVEAERRRALEDAAEARQRAAEEERTRRVERVLELATDAEGAAADALLKQAMAIESGPAPLVAVEKLTLPEVEKTKGLPRREYWSARVDDKRAVVLAVAATEMLAMIGVSVDSLRASGCENDQTFALLLHCIGDTPVALDALDVNMPTLNALARELKDDLRVPGVVAVCEKGYVGKG